MTVKIAEIIDIIEDYAPVEFQDSYDNARLITGSKQTICSSVLLTLDAIEEVVDEAIERECNLILAHHPILFKGLKSLTGKNYVERTIIKAIKHDIAIYACHTNLDNQLTGVNAKICEKLGLRNTRILRPMQNTLLHLITFVPKNEKEKVLQAMFDAGAGRIGNYSHCSFSTEGEGSFLPEQGASPSIGKVMELALEQENRIEVLLPKNRENQVLGALKEAHSYEEVAYYLHELKNENQDLGAGMIGELVSEMNPMDFLLLVKEKMKTPMIRHTKLLDQPIKKVAVCGGAGSFLLPDAIRAKADIFISGDFKYHEFFDADNQLVIADIGHYESEQFTNELFAEILNKKLRNFAVHFSKIDTNPVNYL